MKDHDHFEVNGCDYWKIINNNKFLETPEYVVTKNINDEVRNLTSKVNKLEKNKKMYEENMKLLEKKLQFSDTLIKGLEKINCY